MRVLRPQSNGMGVVMANQRYWVHLDPIRAARMKEVADQLNLTFGQFIAMTSCIGTEVVKKQLVNGGTGEPKDDASLLHDKQ